MARLKSSMLSAGAGKLGGVVFSGGPALLRLRRHRVTRTTLQIVQRARPTAFAHAPAVWASLSAPAKVGWQDLNAWLCDPATLTPPFAVSTLQRFTQAYVYAAALGLTLPTTFPTQPPLPTPIAEVVLTNTGTGFTAAAIDSSGAYLTAPWLLYVRRYFAGWVNTPKVSGMVFVAGLATGSATDITSALADVMLTLPTPGGLISYKATQLYPVSFCKASTIYRVTAVAS